MRLSSISTLIFILVFVNKLYAQNNKIKTLVSSITEINDKKINDDYKGAYQLKKDEASLILSNAELKNRLAQDDSPNCDKSARYNEIKKMEARKSNFTLSFVGSFNSTPINTAKINNQRSGWWTVNDFFLQYQAYLDNNGSNNQTLNTIFNQYKLTNSSDTSTRVKLLQDYNQYMNYNSSDYDNKSLEMSYFAYNVVQANSWNERSKTLAYIKDNYSFDEKIKMTQLFGQIFANNYDYSRAKNDSLNSKNVSCEEILSAVKNGTDAGVCRDISLCMSKLLSKMGVGKTYVVGYATLGGGHATVVTQNPNNAKDIRIINYANAISNNGLSSGAALTQTSDMPNVGVSFKVFNTEGKPVANVPSSVGKALEAQTVIGKIQNDPFDTHSNLTNLTLTYNSKGNTEKYSLAKGVTEKGVPIVVAFKVFHGETEADETLSGASAVLNVGDKNGNIVSGSIGVAGGGINKKNPESFNISASYIYVNSTINVNPKLKANDNVELGMDANVNGQGILGSGSKSGNQSQNNNSSDFIDGALSGTAGGHVTLRNNAKTAAVKISAGTQQYLTFTDLSTQQLGISENMKIVQIEGETKVTKDLSLIINGLYGKRNEDLGGQIKVEAGVRGQSYEVRTGYAGRINDMPIWVPGSERTFIIYGQKDLGPALGDWSLSGSYQHSLESNKSQFNLGVQKKL
ncbi:MAG: hypothetical protein U0T83_01350 [Bacteriovoracaceae bacterium]